MVTPHACVGWTIARRQGRPPTPHLARHVGYLPEEPGGESMNYNICDNSGYDLELDFSDYAEPGSPIWAPDLDGIRDYIDTLAGEIVLKRRVAKLSRGERSILPALPPKKNGKYAPCHFRRHMKGAILEVYGYGLNLAEKDQDGFFWSGFEN